MDFIYVALVAAFWAAIALMARACHVLQGRRPRSARPLETASASPATRRALP